MSVTTVPNRLECAKILLFVSFLIFVSGCTDPYQQAFEKISAREFSYWPVFNASWDEVELLSMAIHYRADLPYLYYKRAEQLQTLNAYQMAIYDYKTCIFLDWESGMLYFELGKCEIQLQQYEAALTDLIIAQVLLEQEWKNTPEYMKTPNHWGDPTADHEELLEKIQSMAAFAESAANFSVCDEKQ
ncbi:MAG: hypothetical protein R2824_21510 [Saprospiraceae bacterium]|nr:hypothetical protein [Lewinella sp.]